MKIFMSDLPKHMNSHASFWLFLRASLIDISPKSFSMLVDAPCCNNI